MSAGGHAVICSGVGALLILGAGCHKVEARRPAPALRLEPAAAGAKSSAPATAALPAVASLDVGAPADPQSEYELLDNAFYMEDAFGDAPPDYAVHAGPAQVWVWRSQGDAMRLVEITGDGYRQYYFDARSPTPYLVRAGDHAYGFDGARFTSAYDSNASVLAKVELTERADEAGRLLRRGQELREVALREPIGPVGAPDWAQALRSQWAAALGGQEPWRASDTAHMVEQTAYWKAEKQRRQGAAERFDRWRRTGFRGRAPDAVEGADGRSEALTKAGLPAPREAEAR